MVWEAIAALAALLTLLVAVIAWAHMSGKLTQKVKDTRKDIEEHARRLNSNDVKIAKPEAYQDVGGVWTIGYGHTGPEVHKGLVWTASAGTCVTAPTFDLRC